MSSIDLSRESRGTDAHRVAGSLYALAYLAVVTLMAVAVAGSTRIPPKVDRLVIDNPHAFNVNVEVSDGRSSGVLSIGHAEDGRQMVVEEVIDQGAVWILRFSSAGVDAGEVMLRRDALERAGWRVRVPDAVPARLQAAGVPPSA
jgi:hypothetical protein